MNQLTDDKWKQFRRCKFAKECGRHIQHGKIRVRVGNRNRVKLRKCLLIRKEFFVECHFACRIEWISCRRDDYFEGDREVYDF